MKNKLYTSIGLMSGTSMDGVDVSVISSDGYDQFTIILNEYFQYGNKLHQQLINLREIVSIKEDLTMHQRDSFWFEMTERMMRDFDRTLEAQIRQHLTAFLK